VDIIRNTTPNGYYGDLIIFNMILPSKKQNTKTSIRGWVEAVKYPGSKLLSFKNAKIMFV